MQTKERISEERTRTRQKPKKNVVYTQAKPFVMLFFIRRLATVLALAIAVLAGMAIFFKVEEVQVSGAVRYDEYAIFEDSGIQIGDSMATLNKRQINARIRQKPENAYIATIRINRKLPGTVVISITEENVFYAAQDFQGGWWLLNPNGKVIDQCSEAQVDDYTKILGVKLSAPEIGAMAAAYEPMQEPDEKGNTVPVTVYAKEQLDLALTVIRQLEKEHFVGTIASVNVSNTSDIQLWYGTRFQMLIGDSRELPKKINALAQAVALKSDYETGILDASFTIWPDQVAHSQFS